MGNGWGVWWGRNTVIKPKVTPIHSSDHRAMSDPPSDPRATRVPGATTSKAACCPVSGRRLVAGDHRTKCHRLRPSDRAVDQRDAPVEGAGGSVLSSVRERIRRSGERGLERACARVGGDRALEHAGGGKGRPLTRHRRVEKSSKSSSSCPRRHREGARGRTLRPAQRERDGRTSQGTRLSICDGDRWKGR